MSGYEGNGSGARSEDWIKKLGGLRGTEVMAAGRNIRELPRLIRQYGKGRWREMKAIGRIRLPDGTVHDAEIHWYEAAGIGRKELKIKRYLELPCDAWKRSGHPRPSRRPTKVSPRS